MTDAVLVNDSARPEEEFTVLGSAKKGLRPLGGTRSIWEASEPLPYTEGSLRILRVSYETEPEPWTYELSFTPYGASDMPPPCDVIGDLQLERALRPGIGLPEHNLRESVKRARHGAVVMHHVRMTDDLMRALFRT